jgi:hypothetical protein
MRNWLVIAFIFPISLELAVSFLLVMFPSGASAEGFAYLIVLVGLMFAVPLTVFANIVLVPKDASWKVAVISRSLILPGIYTVAIVVYYSGFWDSVIDPLLPQQQSKIETASGGWIDDDTWESFYVVNGFEATADEQDLIENYAIRQFQRQTREDPGYSSRNEDFYFVPRELYDPINLTSSREDAVAVFQFHGVDGDTEIRRLR